MLRFEHALLNTINVRSSVPRIPKNELFTENCNISPPRTIVIPEMAESLTQQVSNQLKIIKKSFNRKFAKIVLILLTHKRAGSLGALAGFAIAILFSWKFLRPVGSWRRQKKDTSSTSSNGSASTSLTDSQLTHNAKEVEPTNDLWSPAKPVLEEIVKEKLNGGRKMTCRLLGVILEESIPEELQEHATIRSSVVEVLLEISKFCDMYLMERVLDDESAERVMLALENAGLFKAGYLMKGKVLFCSTENGRSSFVRQLEPDWHVDTDPDILSQLSRFVRNQIHISPTRSSFASGSNMVCSTSMELFFS